LIIKIRYAAAPFEVSMISTPAYQLPARRPVVRLESAWRLGLSK